MKKAEADPLFSNSKFLLLLRTALQMKEGGVWMGCGTACPEIQLLGSFFLEAVELRCSVPERKPLCNPVPIARLCR